MKAAIVRWAFYLAALLFFGPLAAALVAGLRAPNGGPEASPLVSTTPAMGVGLALAALGIALVIGAVAARLVGVMAGMSTTGLIVAWVTWRTGTVEGLVRSAHSGRPLLTLALEGAIFGAVGIALAVVLSRVAAPGRHDRVGRGPVLGDSKSLIAVGWAVLGGAVGAGFLAVSALKGQAVAGAILGGVVIGVVGRLQRVTSLATYMVPIAVLAVLGPLGGVAVAGGTGDVLAAVYRGTLFPVAYPVPLDWLAGGLLGIPLGIGWAGSMVDKKQAS